ncbi:MAG TPA: HIT family protein [Bacteroidetes bacterium]|nr:HIT family protein [Bacteroidota bacterium]
MATIFTKIIRGEIPCYKVAENEQFIAFLDINPVAKGHTLVVPKTEVDYIFDLAEPELSRILIFAQKIAKAIDEVTDCIRTGIIVEGLEVPHAHIHLIPMYPSRKGFSLGHKTDITKEEMQIIASKIAEKVKL